MPLAKQDIVKHFSDRFGEAPAIVVGRGTGQSDWGAYRLQRRLRAAAGHRPGGLDRPPPARRLPRGVFSIDYKRNPRVRPPDVEARKGRLGRVPQGRRLVPARRRHEPPGMGGRVGGRRAAGRRALVLGRAWKWPPPGPSPHERHPLGRVAQAKLGSGPKTIGSASTVASWTS